MRFTLWQTRKTLIFLLPFVLYPATSYAYLDPGTGSYGFQMLMAVGLVLFFTARAYWKKMRSKSPQKQAGSDAAKESHEG